MSRAAFIRLMLSKILSAAIWIKTGASVSAGRALHGSVSHVILASQGNAVAYTGSPIGNALAEWRQLRCWGIGALLALSVILVLLSPVLVRILRQRGVGDRSAAAKWESEAALHLAQLARLDQTVARLTLELDQAKDRLKRELSERRAAEERISLLAHFDPLTGLANRDTFVQRVKQAFAAAQLGAAPFAVLYLDLDHFKDVNDTLGHRIGDLLLRQVANRLRSTKGDRDLVARLGGDEFAVLHMPIGGLLRAGPLAAQISTALARAFTIGGNELHITVSIGISPYVCGISGPDAMLVQADMALYRAKEEGRNRYRFHSADLDEQLSTRMAISEDLRKAIEHGELEVFYQPQVELASGKIVGMEALVRWRHPSRGLLLPAVFIPIAEKTGAILPLGNWVLNEACRQMRSWREAQIAPSVIAINLSLAQLRTGSELIRAISETAAKCGLAPSEIEFDITEATLAQATLAQNNVLPELRRLGYRIALDDFGMEYSSLDYLRAYRVSHLKLARSFVGAALRDPTRAAVVRAIVSIARELGIGVIAEGVENEEQRALLAAMGTASMAQGFHFSEPVSAAQAGEMLRRGSVTPLVAPGNQAAVSLRKHALG